MKCLFWLYLYILVSRRRMKGVITKVLRYTYKIPDIFLRVYATLNILDLFL